MSTPVFHFFHFFQKYIFYTIKVSKHNFGMKNAMGAKLGLTLHLIRMRPRPRRAFIVPSWQARPRPRRAFIVPS